MNVITTHMRDQNPKEIMWVLCERIECRDMKSKSRVPKEPLYSLVQPEVTEEE